MGAHISASPNHQTHRRHTLDFRALVAFAYHFGIELNPLTLSPEERETLKGWITLHKRLRPLLHAAGGQFQSAPVDGRYVWGAESHDKIIALVAQGPHMLGEQPPPLKLPLRQAVEGTWRVATRHPAAPEYLRISETQKKLFAGETSFPLEALTHAGLPLPLLRPESGVLLEFERVSGS